jgi:hypothetical protein
MFRHTPHARLLLSLRVSSFCNMPYSQGANDGSAQTADNRRGVRLSPSANDRPVAALRFPPIAQKHIFLPPYTAQKVSGMKIRKVFRSASEKKIVLIEYFQRATNRGKRIASNQVRANQWKKSSGTEIMHS